MGLKVLSPQEVEVYYVLPAIRSAIVKALVERGMNQKSVASLMGLTGAAVSQYLSGKRAKQMSLSDEMHAKVKALVEHVANPHDVMMATQTLLAAMKAEQHTCRVCQPAIGAPEGCRACF